MASQYFIRVDIGTAGTKAAIFDLQGNQLATAYAEFYEQLLNELDKIFKLHERSIS